jgi:hypothetical protein
MGLATTLGAWFVFTAEQRSLLRVGLIAAVFAVALTVVGYPLFGLTEVLAYIKSRSE